MGSSWHGSRRAICSRNARFPQCAYNRKEAAQNAGKPQLLLRLSRLMYLCAFLSAATLWSHFHLTFGPATTGNSHQRRGCIPPRASTQIPSIPSLYARPFFTTLQTGRKTPCIIPHPNLSHKGTMDIFLCVPNGIIIKSIEHPSLYAL